MKAAAAKEGRSISEENEYRIDRSFMDMTGVDLMIQNSLAERLEKALTRIAELEAAQLNEDAIERVVRRASEEAIEIAITRALAKARLTIGENGK